MGLMVGKSFAISKTLYSTNTEYAVVVQTLNANYPISIQLDI